MVPWRFLQKHIPYKDFGVEFRNANIFIQLYQSKNNTKAGKVLLLLIVFQLNFVFENRLLVYGAEGSAI